jgi:thiol-disulfide isomerase/thioredoxin
MTPPESSHTRRRVWWLPWLAVPLVGVVGALLLLAADARGGDSATPAPRYPTPAPVTFIPPTRVPPTPAPTVESVLDKPVPDITLATLDGDSVRLPDLAGQIVFLNFWASWCEPCRGEMPTLQQLQDTHASQGVTVLAVTDPTDGQDETTIRDFLNAYHLTLTVGLSTDAAFYQQFEVVQIPTTFIIDRAGVVRWRHIGELTDDDITVYLDRLGEQ